MPSGAKAIAAKYPAGRNRDLQMCYLPVHFGFCLSTGIISDIMDYGPNERDGAVSRYIMFDCIENLHQTAEDVFYTIKYA